MGIINPAYLRYSRHLVVDPEGRGDFLTPGAASTYLQSQTRSTTAHWFVELRPSTYQVDAALTIPSFTTWFNPFQLGPERSWQTGSVPRFRAPASGAMSGAFVSMGEGSKLVGVAVDIFVNVTPSGALSVVRGTSSVFYLTNCRVTAWCDATTHGVYCCEINSGVTLYASGTLFALQMPQAQRANAACLWAKGPFSVNADCRFHDDDVAGGTGIIYDTSSESTMRFCSFGTHPKSQFTADLNMVNATGVLWMDGTKVWEVDGNSANAKHREDEV